MVGVGVLMGNGGTVDESTNGNCCRECWVIRDVNRVDLKGSEKDTGEDRKEIGHIMKSGSLGTDFFDVIGSRSTGGGYTQVMSDNFGIGESRNSIKVGVCIRARKQSENTEGGFGIRSLSAYVVHVSLTDQYIGGSEVGYEERQIQYLQKERRYHMNIAVGDVIVMDTV